MAQILDRCVIHISGKKRLSDRSNLKLLIVLSLSFRFPIQEGADLQDLSSSPGSRLLGWKLFKVRPDFRLIATLHSQQSGAMAGLIACPHTDKSGTEPGTEGPETWPMTIWDGPGEVRRVLRAINIHAVMWHLTRNLWTLDTTRWHTTILTEEISCQMLVKIETRGTKQWQWYLSWARKQETCR